MSHRYAKANNEYLPDYDPNSPSPFLIYLDANNLYGYALSEPLPVDKFRFLDDPENFAIDSVDCDGATVRLGGGFGVSGPPSRRSLRLPRSTGTHDRDKRHLIRLQQGQSLRRSVISHS